MGRGKSGRAGLSPRKRAWLSHLEACAQSGEPLRMYARRKGLSEHSLYQAAKDLRTLGVWKSPGAKPRRVESSSFVRVETPRGQVSESAWRIRLPNGVLLEGSADFEVDRLPALLEVLTPL